MKSTSFEKILGLIFKWLGIIGGIFWLFSVYVLTHAFFGDQGFTGSQLRQLYLPIIPLLLIGYLGYASLKPASKTKRRIALFIGFLALIGLALFFIWFYVVPPSARTVTGTSPGGHFNLPTTGTLNGSVDVGPPNCTLAQLDDLECNWKPNYSATSILVYTTDSKLISTIKIDSAGHYSTVLNPGSYLVNYKTNYGTHSTGTAQAITITRRNTTTQNFLIDSGYKPK